MNIHFKQLPLLSGVDENKISELYRKNEIYERHYKKNTTVHSYGEECLVLDIVLSGSLVAYALSQNGSENVMFEFQSGNIIGANLLFGDSNGYPLNIYCLSDCHLLHFTKPAVYELLKEHHFVMQYIRSLSQNSQGMNRIIMNFMQKSLRQNILDYLLALSLEQQSDTVILPLTKKQLADYFGVQRPSLFRVLKELKDEGRIEVKNREIKIKKDSL